MDKHALALLNDTALWKKMGLIKFEAKHPVLVTSLLFHLILESQGLGGSFVDKFWRNLGTCHPRLEENSMSILPIHPFHRLLFHLVSKLKAAPELTSETDVSLMLFNGIQAAKFDCAPIICMAGEYFTHLGLACMSMHFTL
jgi:hypothetical protein